MFYIINLCFVVLALRVQSIIDSALITHFGSYMGSAVAISECLALTAFHGKLNVNASVTVRTAKGVSLSAKVVFVQFEINVVDIAVVQLDSKDKKFDCFVPPCKTRVRLEQPIHVIGLRATTHDSVDQYSKISNVELIEQDTTFFQACYYNFEGCSGTGVVTTLVNGRFEVVGVHVAIHDSTIGVGAKRSIKDLSLEQVHDDNLSICSELHGHSAYCLICEVARVDELVEFLNSTMSS
jgi:hypothetical protein